MDRKVALDYKDFVAFAKFMDDWSSEISKADYVNLFENPAVIEAIGSFVADEIESATDNDPFGRFMADRTYVEIMTTARGVTLHIGGYTEQEMLAMGRPHRLSDTAIEAKKDYNLWEMYEFGGGAIGTKGLPVGSGKQAIVKDVAGPLAIRTRTGGTQELRGRRGLINSIVQQLRPQLQQKLIDIMNDLGGLTAAAAGAEAAGKARALEGLHGKMRRQVRQLAAKLDVDLAKIGFSGGNITVGSGGRVTVRGSGGKVVSSPLTGKRIDVKN